MSGLNLSAVEILWLEKVGVCKTGVSDVLWLAQVGVCNTGVRDVLWQAQTGGCKTGVSAVLWLERGGGCRMWVSDVLCMAQVGGLRIGVLERLLQGLCGLIQETIEYGWIEIFLEQLVYQLYLHFLVCLVQCLCEDGYLFAK